MLKKINKNLPDGYRSQSIIKYSDMVKEKRLNNQLECALNKSKHIFAQAEDELEKLKSESKAEGFKLGFDLLSGEIARFLFEYESIQNDRLDTYFKTMRSCIFSSFIDPQVSTAIINSILKCQDGLSDVTLVVPNGTAIPEDMPQSIHHEYGVNVNFTLLNKSGAIKFPSEVLANSWLLESKKAMYKLDDLIIQSIPAFLEHIGAEMINNFYTLQANKDD